MLFFLIANITIVNTEDHYIWIPHHLTFTYLPITTPNLTFSLKHLKTISFIFLYLYFINNKQIKYIFLVGVLFSFLIFFVVETFIIFESILEDAWKPNVPQKSPDVLHECVSSLHCLKLLYIFFVLCHVDINDNFQSIQQVRA